jgi:hypothetical protein
MIGDIVIAPVDPLQKTLTMNTGDQHEFRFVIPLGVPCGEATVISNGFYQRLR